jgi:hypothetical protein
MRVMGVHGAGHPQCDLVLESARTAQISAWQLRHLRGVWYWHRCSHHPDAVSTVSVTTSHSQRYRDNSTDADRVRGRRALRSDHGISVRMSRRFRGGRPNAAGCCKGHTIAHVVASSASSRTSGPTNLRLTTTDPSAQRAGGGAAAPSVWPALSGNTGFRSSTRRCQISSSYTADSW